MSAANDNGHLWPDTIIIQEIQGRLRHCAGLRPVEELELGLYMLDAVELILEKHLGPEAAARLFARSAEELAQTHIMLKNDVTL